MEEITKYRVEIAESMNQILDYVDIVLLMTNSKNVCIKIKYK